MFRRLFRNKEKRETEDIRRAFEKCVSPEIVESLTGSPALSEDTFSLREGEIGYVLAWVRADTPEALSRRLGRAAGLGTKFGGDTQFMISGLIVFSFGLLPLPTPPKGRASLVEALYREFGKDIKIVHGSGLGRFGNLGGPERMDYSFILADFEAALAVLCGLEFGQTKAFFPPNAIK